MNTIGFLALPNVEILWEVIVDENILYNKNDFEKILLNFYEKEKNNYDDLFSLNKSFISSVIKPPTIEKVPITFKELQNEKISHFNRDLIEKEENFKQTMSRPVPTLPNFRDKMDEPLNEMESIIKRTIAERNYDIVQITNEHLKGKTSTQEPSIKKEKLSPLFFNSSNGSSSEIKYIKIDPTSYNETPHYIDLSLANDDKTINDNTTSRITNNIQSKHISWNQTIKKEYLYNDVIEEDGVCCLEEVNPQTNRIEQMKQIHKTALEIFTKKNTDYGDSFATYGIIGILIRIEDKLRRAISINKNSVTLVKDESLRDTLLDLHNYAAMGLMLLEE